MMLKLVLATALARGAMGLLQRDVPNGMCFKCEINCMQDCTNKYHEEVMGAEFRTFNGRPIFLQRDAPEPVKISERIVSTYISRLTAEGKHSSCAQKTGCSLANQCADSVQNELQTVQDQGQREVQSHAEDELDYGHEIHDEHKAWTDVASQQVTIADFPTFHAPSGAHSHSSVSEADLDRLDRGHMSAERSLGLAKLNQTTKLAPTGEAKLPYPLHPVKRQVFTMGKQTLTQCMKYCFAATCGCEDSPMTGTVKETQELTKQAIASGKHFDTPPTYKYKKATKKQCGSNIQKVVKGLYIIYHAGKGGTQEVCSEGLFKLKAGTSGALGLTDPLEDMYKCDCGINRLDCNEPDFGCSWNEISQRCEFKAMHNTVCYHRYVTDKTFLQSTNTTL